MPANTRLPSDCLPFLTLPDPPVTGEGALDPLGLATTGERLADWILPGMTARMNRPRFLTAIAVSAVVCQDLSDEDRTAADGVTPGYLVFEWLVVEGFARMADRLDVQRTPGIDKARACVRSAVPMSAMNYLKAPTVFGFHGVYRRLARHVGIIDEHDILLENGYLLLKTWEREQGIEGFLDSARANVKAANRRQLLLTAVKESLAAGYTSRSAGWQGWQFLAQHLVPAAPGRQETALLRRLLLDGKAEPRGEMFQLLERPENLAFAELNHEAALVRHLLPQASPNLAQRFRAIMAYEDFCVMLETAFDWLRWLSSRAGACAVAQTEFVAEQEVRLSAERVPARLAAAATALGEAPLSAQREFGELTRYFDAVTDAASLHGALLGRHRDVQRAKPPEGKRPWFEEADAGGVFVRAPYRLDEAPTAGDGWSRPYRLESVYSFCRDLRRG
jgi:hypothetical protein